jgi:hypothetical protein
MPRTALAATDGPCLPLSPRELALLLRLQAQGLSYFLDNQTADGLMLDRQANHGPRRPHGLVSTAATGMGFIALALASAEPYRRISPSEAVARVRRGVATALERLPHTRGVLPHFVHSATGRVIGLDQRSTVDTAWLAAGALWAAAFLGDSELQRDAGRLYDRIDWRHWAVRDGLLVHGADRRGRILKGTWDRLNGETVFMYVLAAGAEADRAWPADGWGRLNPCPGETGGLRFGCADLGLFVFQYGLDLLDLRAWSARGGADLDADAGLAVEANWRLCRSLAGQFVTYQHYWGLSAGDGPCHRGRTEAYRCYAPGGPVDGTAHVTATLASLARRPELVWENLWRAAGDSTHALIGRYGVSNVNLDCLWVSRDAVGIDLGAAVLALDNILASNRVRKVFHALPAVAQGLQEILSQGG